MNIEFQTMGDLFCGLGGGGETGIRYCFCKLIIDKINIFCSHNKFEKYMK